MLIYDYPLPRHIWLGLSSFVNGARTTKFMGWGGVDGLLGIGNLSDMIFLI